MNAPTIAERRNLGYSTLFEEDILIRLTVFPYPTSDDAVEMDTRGILEAYQPYLGPEIDIIGEVEANNTGGHSLRIR